MKNFVIWNTWITYIGIEQSVKAMRHSGFVRWKMKKQSLQLKKLQEFNLKS